jgi:hypothetical protein
LLRVGVNVPSQSPLLNLYVTSGFVTAAKATSLSLQFTTRLGALQGVLVGTFGY